MGVFDLFNKKEMNTAGSTTKQADAPNGTADGTKGKPTDTPTTKDEPQAPEEAATTITEGTKRVHNLIILDESGSMQSIYQPALSGVNETLQTIRGAQEAHKDQTHFVTLVTFDSNHYNPIYGNTPAEKAADITEKQYCPGGLTPLYDAMGRAINELRPDVAEGDVVLVTVITDGYENASREYSGKAIKSLVETMKKAGWVFTYIGANQDVEAVASAMSIDNRLAFDADEASTKEMFARERRSRVIFYSKVSSPRVHEDLSTGYFDEEEEGGKEKPASKDDEKS